MLITAFMHLINIIIKALGALITLVFSLLPNSPFQFLMNGTISSFLSGLNWFIPVTEIIVTLEVWVSAILVYYLYSIALRWIKAIE